MDYSQNAQMIQGGFGALDQGMEAHRQEAKKEEEKNRPLSPYEQHVAEHIHRLVFGNEPVDQIIASYKGGGSGGMQPQGAMQPQQMMGARAPTPQAAGLPPSQLSPYQPGLPDVSNMGMLGALNATGGFSDLVSGAPSQIQAPPQQAQAAPPPDQIQGGLRQMPVATAARGAPPMPQGQPPQPQSVGPDGQQPPEPRTRADFDALMNFVHSGVPGALARSQDVERRLASVESENALNRNSRERVAAQATDTKKSEGEANRTAKAEDTDKRLAAYQQKHEEDMKVRREAIDASLQRARIMAQTAMTKGGDETVKNLQHELDRLERGEIAGQKQSIDLLKTEASIMTDPAAKAKLEARIKAEESTLVGQEKEKADLTVQLHEAMKKLPKGGSASSKTSVSAGSPGAAAAMINVIRKSDGAPGKIPAANFDPAKYTKQ